MNTIYKRGEKNKQNHVIFFYVIDVLLFLNRRSSPSQQDLFFWGFFALIVANVLTVFLSNTHLRHRWSARPTGSWMQTIHWPFIPALRLQLRQRWKWSTRPSTCRTPATPLLLVHLSLPLFPFLPLSVSLSLFAMLWNCESPPPLPAVILLLPLLSSVCLCGFLISTAACLYAVLSIRFFKKEQQADADNILSRS